MQTNDYFVMASILVYLGGMIILGAVYTRKNRSTEDFYLGGRRLGPLVTAMSAEASPARSGTAQRPARSGLDGNRACGRHISELAACCKTDSGLQPSPGRGYGS